eukprot:GHVO01034845.1.p1 GENE.GHVO01034845.1~~GHVO01034845.1.p1  ORF type:complete len:157 (-),score=37.51 GHVO01034845.1:245-715(-)
MLRKRLHLSLYLDKLAIASMTYDIYKENRKAHKTLLKEFKAYYKKCIENEKEAKTECKKNEEAANNESDNDEEEDGKTPPTIWRWYASDREWDLLEECYKEATEYLETRQNAGHTADAKDGHKGILVNIVAKRFKEFLEILAGAPDTDIHIIHPSC